MAVGVGVGVGRDWVNEMGLSFWAMAGDGWASTKMRWGEGKSAAD